MSRLPLKLQSSTDRVGNLQSALEDLLSQEFDWSTGHVATLLNGCVFAPSILTFWFVNGAIDFSTALVIGSITSPVMLQVRLIAYLLLVPVFLAIRAGYYLVHPVHRETVLAGACPQSRLLSLDWFSVGILATGLPLALQDFGPWFGMNAVFLVGVFVASRFVGSERVSTATRLGALGFGTALFLYAKYGGALAGAVPLVPAPAAVVGPVATFALTDATTGFLMRVVNSILFGPAVVAAVGFALNRVLTRPELTDLPYLHHSLPERDPGRVVVTSAALGTVFYLGVLAALTGRLVVVP